MTGEMGRKPKVGDGIWYKDVVVVATAAAAVVVVEKHPEKGNFIHYKVCVSLCLHDGVLRGKIREKVRDVDLEWHSENSETSVAYRKKPLPTALRVCLYALCEFFASNGNKWCGVKSFAVKIRTKHGLKCTAALFLHCIVINHPAGKYVIRGYNNRNFKISLYMYRGLHALSVQFSPELHRECRRKLEEGENVDRYTYTQDSA